MKCGEETDLKMRKNVLRKYQYAQRSHGKIVTKLRVALIRREVVDSKQISEQGMS